MEMSTAAHLTKAELMAPPQAQTIKCGPLIWRSFCGNRPAGDSVRAGSGVPRLPDFLHGLARCHFGESRADHAQPHDEVAAGVLWDVVYGKRLRALCR